ncbi:MAG: tyrosine-type recombinase/integrase [Clostridium paraputrificum]|uniref:tyrosine-type recombinase/integrase n=1 Tax=Clostridium sp. TaxID=1506 RepID=UPI0025C47616|nr:tyrosine-type recombinase/integrase [Clostridium sp.]MBS5926228.1 tyrosine-type recombinase/integrase [Clostridium sp.]
MEYNFLDAYQNGKIENTFLSQHINKFYFAALDYYKNKLSKKSIYLILRRIESFEKFMYYQYPAITELNDIKEEHIESFKTFCSEGLKNSNKTVNGKLTALKYFFKYLSDKELINYNICLNVPKLQNPLIYKTTHFSHSDLKILFSTMRKDKFGIRDLLISIFILRSGMSVAEVLNMKLGNVIYERYSITSPVTGKEYPLDSDVFLDIKHYMYIRSELNVRSSDFLFLSKIGTNYSVRSYEIYFKKAIEKTNLPSSLSPRYLRTTFCSNMARIANEEDLKEILQQEKVDHYYKLFKNNPLRNIR